MFKTVTLEMSLKPFKQTDPAYIEAVIRKVFTQWRPLLEGRETIAIMLWAADGSEILDYAGNLEDSFEWARFVGTANRELLQPEDRQDLSLHEKKQHYMPNAPVMTYGILKSIVSAIKSIGAQLYPGSRIQVVETFDIGPEFSISDFKYRRHPEISSGSRLDSFGFVDATALLHADDRAYAAYPHGIPEGTRFATFLGKQSSVFLKDMGFDALWLSNGLGFSANPWDMTGKIFDGENFHAEKLASTRQQVFAFWKLFRESCPDFPLLTRGTNNSVGIDYATDGVPLSDIYTAGLDIAPPPNSPWAALNDDFGLEIMGHMTRICNLPGEEFLFRYYIHDPWWVNSPWYDRYGQQPHDIYMPMAISRIDADGRVQSAELFSILTIDNSFGDMPDCCVNEPLPHILKAEKDAADAVAPLVWVYPMEEFTTAESEAALKEMYVGDHYIRQAINHGLPLNCVVSTNNFLKHDLSVYKASLLISPLPQTKEVADKLQAFVNSGGQVIYYGTSREDLPEDAAFVDSQGDPCAIRELLEKSGWAIRFDQKRAGKTCAMTLACRDNGLLLSVYNPDLTMDTLLKFPLGAPIFTGMDAELRDGFAAYRFGRSEHLECRVFVRQEAGIVSAKEIAPVSILHHRKFTLEGLEDATVCIFPESRGAQALAVDSTPRNVDETPVYDSRFCRVEDPIWGIYYRAEHITGDYTVLLPRN